MISQSEIRAAAGDITAWQPHLDNPYGAEALQDPERPYFTLGPIEIPERICVNDNNEALEITDALIKGAGSGALYRSRCLSNVCWDRNFKESGLDIFSPQAADRNFHCNSPDLLTPLHKGFGKIARHILGKELYTSSDIIFTHERSAVNPGEGQLETKWHVDMNPGSGAIMMGILSDELPTQVLRNPTTPDDYEDGYLKSVDGVPLEEAELDYFTLPANHLAIVPISTPHRGQLATEHIPRRNFLRWWVLYQGSYLGDSE